MLNGSIALNGNKWTQLLKTTCFSVVVVFPPERVKICYRQTLADVETLEQKNAVDSEYYSAVVRMLTLHKFLTYPQKPNVDATYNCFNVLVVVGIAE